MLDPKDGGYKSRKLWYAVGTSAGIFVSCILAATFLPNLATMLDTLVGGLIAVLTVFCGANVGNKLVVGKTAPATATKTQALKGQPVEQVSED